MNNQINNPYELMTSIFSMVNLDTDENFKKVVNTLQNEEARNNLFKSLNNISDILEQKVNEVKKQQKPKRILKKRKKRKKEKNKIKNIN